MEKNVCNICGGRLVPKNGRWVCEACGAFKAEEINNEEITLIYQANEQVRLGNFDEAEEMFSHLIELYPDDSEGYWGYLCAHYGIKYEIDYNGKAVPTCYNASYDPFLESPYYAKALERADDEKRAFYQREAARIEAIREEWVEKAEAEPEYDVFLSYKDTEFGPDGVKTDDYHRVYEIYNHLTSLGYRVFFARKSLSDKAGERNYEPYIFRALNTAAVMIVYASKPEYASATWVKNEWSRFLKRIERGEKPSNALAVAFEGFNPSALPKPLNQIQNFDAGALTFINELDRYVEGVVANARLSLPKIERVSISPKPSAEAKAIGGAKLKKAGGVVPAKASSHGVSAIQSREFGLGCVNTLTGNAENRLLTAKEYIKKRRFDDANTLLDEVLANDKRNGTALYLRMLANSESEDIDAFLKKIESFEDYDLLGSAIDYNERSFSEELLRRLCEVVESLFSVGGLQPSLRLYRQIASYGSSLVLDLHKYISKESPIKLSIAKNEQAKTILVEHLNVSLLYLRSDESLYKKSLQNAINVLLKDKSFEIAGQYLFEYKNSFGADAYFLVQSFIKDSSTHDLTSALKRFDEGTATRLAEVLNSMPEEDCDALLDRISDICLSFIAIDDYDPAHALAKFLQPFEFPKRKEFRDDSIRALTNSAEAGDYPLFKTMLGYYESGEQLAFISDYEKYADCLLAKRAFATAFEAYSDLKQYAPNSERILFNRLLSVCECANEDKLSDCIWSLSETHDFEPVESYLSIDSDDAAFLARLDKLSSSALANFVEGEEMAALRVFERLSSYYPAARDKQLSSDYLFIAKTCQKRAMFDFAVKYYSLSIGLNVADSSVYWGLLQAKLHCKDDDELIRSPQPIADMPEFNNAIVSAGRDQAAVSRYVGCRVKQEEQIARTRKRKTVGRRIALWSAIVAFIVAVSVTIAVLTKNVFIPSSIYDTGISLINEGNYRQALETLEGLGYSDSDSQILVAKAGLAFQEGDYETGISRMQDAGGAVRINYDADGGTTNQSAPKRRPIRKDAYVNAIAEKPGYTFVEWKQQSYSIATKRNEYAAEVGLKASYEIVTYHISYDLGGGELDNPITEYTVLASDISISAPYKRGYTFTGWSGTNIDGTQMAITIPAGSVGDRSYVAHWIADEYIITYDYGHGDKGSQTVTYDQDYSLEQPTRPGYIFKGWRNGDDAFLDGNWQNVSDIELTADWEIIEYSITYGLDGGINSGANPDKYTVEDSVSLKEPTKVGYSFVGWSSALSSKVEKNMTIPKGTIGDMHFEAHWVANEYLITYDYGFGENRTQTVVYDHNYELDVPTRPGYEFLGWTKEGDGFEGGTWEIDGDVRLEAQWAIVEYSISYELNGGANSSENPFSYNVESDDISLRDPSLTGHTFVGWTGGEYSQPTKGIVIPKGSTGNRSFTAHWIANEYFIDYDYGYDDKTDRQTVTYGQDYEVITPNREGYEFLGWNEGETLVEDGIWLREAGASLTARWSAIEYDITYILGGGENSPSNPSAYTAEFPDVVLLSPLMTGYEFLGWSEGDGEPCLNPVIPSGSTGSRTFTANWRPRSYLLSLDPQGGVTSYSEKNVEFDSAFELPTPAREGYTFAGWFDVETNAQVQATTWTWPNDLSVYAKWETISYEITYVLNGGTNANINPSSYTIESDDITISNPSRAGYTFMGWKTDYIESVYSPTIQRGSIGDREFEATWAANLNAIVFHGNGATSGETEPVSGHTDEIITLPENGFERAGYHFAGWSYSADGLVAHADGGEMTVGTDSTISLYAVWTPNSNTITFHPNGGSGTMPSQSMSTDETSVLDANSYVKEGYHFAGWAVSEDGVSSYTNGGSYTMGSDSNYDLYATWEPNSYIVALDANGGSCVSETSITYDADYSLPVPTREGYYFCGWYHGNDQLTDATGAALGEYAIASDITATAHWDAKINVVILTDGNESVQVTGHSDSYVRLPANTFDGEDGHLFDGWATTQDGDVVFQDKDLYYVGTKSSYTLHAVFGDYSDYIGIAHKDQFIEIFENTYADSTISKNYYLSNDIDLEGCVFNRRPSFSGVFNGRGHTIYNYVLCRSNCSQFGDDGFSINEKGRTVSSEGDSNRSPYCRTYYSGLFATNLGTISNLTVQGISIDFSQLYESFDSSHRHQHRRVCVGLIVGVNQGEITNCMVNFSGAIELSKVYDHCIGGIAGINRYIIDNCSVNMNVFLSGSLSIECVDGIPGTSGANYRYADLRLGGIAGSSAYYYGDENIKAVYEKCDAVFCLNEDSLSRHDSNYFFCGAMCGSYSGGVTDCHYLSSYDAIGTGGGNGFEPSNTSPIEQFRNSIKYIIEGNVYYQTFISHETKSQLLFEETKPGYTLIGWSFVEGGQAIYGLDEEVGLPPYQNSATLYAVWQKNTNTITFHGNGATSGEMGDIAGYTDDLLTLPASSFVRDGYHFAGWARSSVGEAAYSDGETIAVPADSTIDLYAVWAPNENAIVFHTNGGSGAMESQTGLSDSTFALNPCSFEAPDGYYFAGWALRADGEPVLADCALFTMTTASNYHLYAVWREI